MRILFASVFVLFASMLRAGTAAELIAEIERRTLVIVLESTIKAKYDKLDADGKAAYTKAVENYNRKVREVSAKFWTINRNIEFKTWEEVNALIKDGSDNYLLLYAGNYSIDPKYVVMIQKGLKFYPEIFADNDERNYHDFYTSFKLCFIEDFRKDKHIIGRTVSNLWPLKEDMVFAFQYIQCLLNETKATNESTNAGKIVVYSNKQVSKSTLVLRDDLVPPALNTELIKRNYPFTFQVISRDSLLKEIMNKENVVYVEIVPVMVGTGEALRLGYEQVGINASTGLVCIYLPVNYAVLHATMGHGTFQKFVSTGALQKYAGISGKVIYDE